MKGFIRQILEHPIIGRPLRKALWLLTWVTEKSHWLATTAFSYQPYVQKLTQLDYDHDEAVRRLEQDRALVRYFDSLRASMGKLSNQPKISVLIPVYRVRTDFLEECLGSLAAQIYENWEACIVDDASGDAGIDSVLEKFAQRFAGKVRYAKNASNLHISLSTNRALELASGEFVALLDHDDRLLPNALAEVVRFINIHSATDIFYSDECIIDTKGDVLGTYHKPDWSPLMHLSVNYTTHLSVYRRTLLSQIGGCRKGFEGAQDHDVMMRAVEASPNPVVHIPLNLYQWRSHELSTASSSGAKPYAGVAGVKAVTEACERRGFPATVTFEPHLHHYRVGFQIPQPSPLVSIIIPSKNSFFLVKSCLDSIFNMSSYGTFEVVLVDHDSTDLDCLQLFDAYEQKQPGKFRRVIYRGAFNFAAMNNLGAREAKGDFVLLLNNDTEVLTPTWLEELLSVAQLPNVGAVGAKLRYPNGKIQHAGIVGSGSYIAHHLGLGEKSDSLSYFGYLQTTHEVLAVTGACLMIARAKFEQVGGLEEVNVPNGFGDVDFCLKLRRAGYTNIYVPYAELVHKESVTRKITFELFERYHMYQNWAAELMLDPYRNISFELGTDFKIEKQFRVQEPSAELMSKLIATANTDN